MCEFIARAPGPHLVGWGLIRPQVEVSGSYSKVCARIHWGPGKVWQTPARKRWGSRKGRLPPRSHTLTRGDEFAMNFGLGAETFGAQRVFTSFAQKGLLVQDIDFWCKRLSPKKAAKGDFCFRLNF